MTATRSSQGSTARFAPALKKGGGGCGAPISLTWHPRSRRADSPSMAGLIGGGGHA